MHTIWEYVINNVIPLSVNEVYSEKLIPPHKSPPGGLCKNCKMRPTRFLIKDGKSLKLEIIKQCRLQDAINHKGQYPDFEFYNVRYEFHLLPKELLFKKLTLKKRDVNNFVKVIEDALFEYLKTKNADIDDKLVVDSSTTKRISTTGYNYIKIIVSASDFFDNIDKNSINFDDSD